jgi:hypothetical protein
MMVMMKSNELLDASFRDPNGFLFTREGELFRQVNLRYQPDYDLLMQSGLYERLVSRKLLVEHDEVNEAAIDPNLAYKIIQPEQVAFISYPYEWCFSQMKDAALATLKIQKIALKHGMSLKDASAYNIQFHHGAPTLIDTLSIEIYKEGEPWVAYRQFCQHFLAPLTLMAYRDVRLSQLLRIYIDGPPLDLVSQLLPTNTWLNLGLLTHIHLHAQAYTHYADKNVKDSRKSRRMSKEALTELISHLEGIVRKLAWNPAGTEWADYYNQTNYSEDAFDHKKSLITDWVRRMSPSSVWDLGANNGEFTRLATKYGIQAVAFDIDPAAVEQNYRAAKENEDTSLLPLVLDLTNPSPALGWHNRERNSLLERGPAKMVFALALIHHLAIANNLPLERIATFLSHATSRWLIVEFVPKSDSQVQKLLANRLDIFDNYTQNECERAFEEQFTIQEKVSISESERTIYLMERV